LREEEGTAALPLGLARWNWAPTILQKLAVEGSASTRGVGGRIKWRALPVAEWRLQAAPDVFIDSIDAAISGEETAAYARGLEAPADGFTAVRASEVERGILEVFHGAHRRRRTVDAQSIADGLKRSSGVGDGIPDRWWIGAGDGRAQGP